LKAELPKMFSAQSDLKVISEEEEKKKKKILVLFFL
jgi:hypothetical protein